ncbi:MAG: hypothetical protein C4K58_04315 [Flavobacteriaceae bacterium]|nr:MAG: hypothetical protein C4K58_04315 [Flavobacteriaceae bacterium]
MLKKLWNADFSDYKYPNFKYVWILMATYIMIEGMLMPWPETFFTYFEKWVAQYPSLAFFGQKVKGIPLGALIIASILVVYLYWFVQFVERRAAKTIGTEKLRQIVVPHFLTIVLDLAVTFVFLLLIQYAVGVYIGKPFDIFNFVSLPKEGHVFQGLIDWYNSTFASIPTLIHLPFPIAFLVTIILADLPVYIFHYSIHWSRVLWLTIHRSHHTPEYLHPFGAGPVFAFAFIFLLPSFFLKLAISKLVYIEPILDGLVCLHVVVFILEKFSHSNPFYHVAFKNKFLYQLFHMFGSGPFHLAHHSAREGEEIVNLANLGFLFWDRVFGTYKKPDPEIPPVGLTNQPKIIMNPLRLYLSGFATIFYELKHNSPKHWFKILFGSVYYTPPVTKDFLIVSYPEKMVATQ